MYKKGVKMVRKISYKDIKNIVDIISTYHKETNNTKIKESDIVKTINQLLDSGNNLYVGVDSSDNVVAFINFHLCYFPLIGGKEYYISELFVSSSHRGMNFGSELLEFVIEKAKLDGCKRILLNNAKTSKAFERSFYAKHGFMARDFMANFIMEL